MRGCPAPSARRTLISFVRDAARASVRLATLAHAITSTSPTTPRSMRSRARTSATMPLWSGTTLTLAFQLAGIAHGKSAGTCV